MLYVYVCVSLSLCTSDVFFSCTHIKQHKQHTYDTTNNTRHTYTHTRTHSQYRDVPTHPDKHTHFEYHLRFLTSRGKTLHNVVLPHNTQAITSIAQSTGRDTVVVTGSEGGIVDLYVVSAWRGPKSKQTSKSKSRERPVLIKVFVYNK